MPSRPGRPPWPLMANWPGRRSLSLLCAIRVELEPSRTPFLRSCTPCILSSRARAAAVKIPAASFAGRASSSPPENESSVPLLPRSSFGPFARRPDARTLLLPVNRAAVRRLQAEQLGCRQLPPQSVLPSLSSFPRCPHRITGTAPRRPEAPNRGRNPLPGERPCSRLPLFAARRLHPATAVNNPLVSFAPFFSSSRSKPPQKWCTGAPFGPPPASRRHAIRRRRCGPVASPPASPACDQGRPIGADGPDQKGGIPL
jgi:hypothetical protein